ncbi:Gfo/Idh/MocA family oxidoreductase [Dactylosporangium sp. AC04546]|uniref:Gfo/Idh/MocA family protein n=1 Tax=Dactylosporangium sp. AC04546 TaxID=2862460 RepID=UPI001EDF107F|nr:Gfo/Idh/MocA family oxidoreductase [Dactylosporangium sp. AC04546]WVK89114.1 Gfo/Idh/MocA family oxidoreductase [Dactylosporangium sp. AC04546]
MTPRAIVVGTGFGLRVHVPALRAAGFEVAALVGQDAGRTARRAARVGVPAGFDTLPAALEATGADVVTIATPPDTHAELAGLAVAAGRHVICEKPLALSVEQAEAMAKAADAAGVVALVGTEFRWDPAIEAVRAAIAAGRIGRPHTATVVRSYPILAAADAGAPGWWFDPARGGGWLRANGTHLIDQLQLWLGPIVEVSATLGQAVPRSGGGADDGYGVLFRTADGAVGVLQECAAAWGEPVEVTRVAGTAGTVSVADGRARLTTPDGSHDLTPDVAPPPSTEPGDTRPWTAQEIASYTGLARWLHQRLSGTAEAGFPRPATFADGLAVLRVVEAIQASAEQRRTITLGGLA